MTILPIIFFSFALFTAIAGVFMWRSGDRSAGQDFARSGATYGSLATGMWLVSNGRNWLGWGFLAVGIALSFRALLRADRAALRSVAPMFSLVAAAIAALGFGLAAAWLGAPHAVVMVCLGIGALATLAFAIVSLVSAGRTWLHVRRATRT